MALTLCLMSVIAFCQQYVPCPEQPLLTDIEGNQYQTIKIGNTCWMKEDLRCSFTNNFVYSSSEQRDGYTFYYYINLENRCPSGWKLPSSMDYYNMLQTCVDDSLLVNNSLIPTLYGDTSLSGLNLNQYTYTNGSTQIIIRPLFYNSETEYGALWQRTESQSGFHNILLNTNNGGFYFIRCIKDTSYTEVEQPTNDTIFIHDTITLVDTLYIYDTIHIHDTITITDTIYIHNGDAGIHEWGKNVKLYPNPASETITLENAEGCECFLYDINGAMIRKYHLSNSVEHLDIYDLSNGIYFIKIVNGGKFNMLKIIKG